MKIMYSLLYVVVILVGLLGSFVQACPLCVGELEADTPAFFSDEYYKAPDADSVQKPVAHSANTQPSEQSQEVQS